MKRIVIGIVAHVDAGKTTLAEAMLYETGMIRRLGRVDHKDCFLDTHELERARGITIFSKQARLSVGDTEITLLDTPGHVDFSAEAWRCLHVMDYAVMVISGMDGVQAHSETLWQMLRKAGIPCFIFVSKTDLPGKSRAALMDELNARFGECCVDLSDENDLEERIAMCDESALEEFLESGTIGVEKKAELISQRKLVPCFFGAGLRLEGVKELLNALDTLTEMKSSAGELGARVYKISRDSAGTRLTHLKIVSGCLGVRSLIKYKNRNGDCIEEKINQLRIYSGDRYEQTDTAYAGQTVAAAGLTDTYAGQGIGSLGSDASSELESVMSYTLILPTGTDAWTVFQKLRQLQEEDPQLSITWNEQNKSISVNLMGAVQREILKNIIAERFDISVQFDAGHIMYRETIENTVEGVGHFEPLRHYAEVHLIMEPLPRGSGLLFETSCSEDELDRNWQRLILTHLAEKKHLGVLTGSPITDMKITLAAGRAHIKHTEGGDFRQATYRAVRQGLMQAKSVLLEPWYSFTMAVPPESLGRAMGDVKTMGGETAAPETCGELVEIKGTAPVSGMNGYIEELTAYTRGRGRLSVSHSEYRPCRDQQSIIDAIGYDAKADLDNTPDSVFCAHGSGVNISWDKVKDNMHLESCLAKKKTGAVEAVSHRLMTIDEKELEAIMEREFGPIRRREYGAVSAAQTKPVQINITADSKKYVIIDGYNLLFSWPELKNVSEGDMDLARGMLMNILSNYAGYTKTEVILVFDGYRNPGSKGTREVYSNIHVAYTADGETGDAYIERMANDIGKNFSVRVVTSDNLIRLSAMRSGVLRTSSKEFQKEAEGVLGDIDKLLRKTNDRAHLTRLENGKQ